MGAVVAVLRSELGTGSGGAVVQARKRLNPLDHEVREGEANLLVRFAWLVVAQRRQRRAAELAAAATAKQRTKKKPW
jgi:hypothetical protein